jgi:hypothetical protein
MSLRREPPPRLPPVAVPSSKDRRVLPSGIAIGHVGLYSVSMLVWACFFAVTLVFAC